MPLLRSLKEGGEDGGHHKQAAPRRLKGVSSADLDQFVGALRGQKLSVRQMEGLAHGFFRGPPSFRQELLQGHLTLALRQLAVSRPTVRRAIEQQGESPRRAFVPPLDPELVRGLYAQCEGYVQRVWEKLREEHGVEVKYSAGCHTRCRAVGCVVKNERPGTHPAFSMRTKT